MENIKKTQDNILEELLKTSTLEEKIKYIIIMHDYRGWENGKYIGNMHEIVPDIMKEIDNFKINPIEKDY